MENELEKWMADRLIERAGVQRCEKTTRCLVELFSSARQGNLCIHFKEAASLPEALCSEGTSKGIKTPLVYQDDRLYLQKNWALESGVIEKIKELCSRKDNRFDETLFLSNLERANLAKDQIEAIKGSYSSFFSLFTGGPGTGKTYTAGHLIRFLSLSISKVFKVAIAAPTGKAAAHLEAALHQQGAAPNNLSLESTTLHRLLRIAPGRQRFDLVRSIDADLVVVDEASMLDVSLLLQLLLAIGPQTKLLLLGDPDQLPPVESGSLFAELAELFGHRLTRSHRMGDGNLFDFAKVVNEGKCEEALEILARGGDVLRIEKDFSLSGRNDLIEWLIDQIPSPLYPYSPDPGDAIRSQKRFRILSGLRQGLLGIDELNRLIEARFATLPHEWIAIPILIVKNDFRLELFNGTEGVLIRKKGQRWGKAYFNRAEGLIQLPEASLPAFELGYCLSVHKSQGSEYEEVLALFPPGSERFGREALYTAITRAKKKITVCIDRETLEKTLAFRSRRVSGLKARMNLNSLCV